MTYAVARTVEKIERTVTKIVMRWEHADLEGRWGGKIERDLLYYSSADSFSRYFFNERVDRTRYL